MQHITRTPGLNCRASLKHLTEVVSLERDLAICRVAQRLAPLDRGFIENLERLTFAVSLTRELGVCRFAHRLARSSPQSSALTKLRHGPLTCGNAWLL
jgi:hypothetical protein